MEITPIIIDSLNALFILIRVWSATKLIKKDIFAPPMHSLSIQNETDRLLSHIKDGSRIGS